MRFLASWVRRWAPAAALAVLTASVSQAQDTYFTAGSSESKLDDFLSSDEPDPRVADLAEIVGLKPPAETTSPRPMRMAPDFGAKIAPRYPNPPATGAAPPARRWPAEQAPIQNFFGGEMAEEGSKPTYGGFGDLVDDMREHDATTHDHGGYFPWQRRGPQLNDWRPATGRWTWFDRQPDPLWSPLRDADPLEGLQ